MDERNGALGWFAGALVLATAPLTVVAVMLTGGRSEGLAEPFMEAGPFVYAVFGLTLLASLAAMVFLGLSGTRPALAPLALGTFAPVLVVALLGLKLGQASAASAIENASPADRLTILAGAAWESLTLSLIAALACGLAFGLVGLGSLLTVARAPRAPRLVTALTAGVLGLASFALAFHTSGVIGTFRAVAHANPADRGVILGESFMELEPRHALTAGLLGLALLLGGAGGVVVMRTAKTAGVMLIVNVVFAAAAMWGLDHGSRSVFTMTSAIEPWLTNVFDVVGGPGDAWDALSLEGTSAPEELDAKIDEHATSYRNADQHRVSVMASRALSSPMLRRVMLRAAKNGAHLELIGHGKPVPVVSPEWSRHFVELLSERASAARIELRNDEACADCTGRAKLVGETLEVSLGDAAPAKWELGTDPHFNRSDTDEWKPAQLDFAWDGGLENLVKAASIAFTHGAVLNVVAK